MDRFFFPWAKNHKDEVKKNKKFKSSHHTGWAEPRLTSTALRKQMESACHYLALGLVAFAATGQTFCFSPRTHRDLTASRCPFSTADCG